MFRIIFLEAFLIALLISVAMVLLLLQIEKKARKKMKKGGNKQRLSARHMHNKNVGRLGGVAIILSFVASVLLNKHLVITDILIGILIAGLGILIFGLWDDFKEIHWRWQFLFQVAIVFLLFVFGVKIDYITNPFGGVVYFDTALMKIVGMVILLSWSLILINAINWIDGLDGLSGGISLLATLTIFFLALKPEVNQPPVALLAMILAGSLAGFLIFNFYPAKIMAGTSGSFFMGFVLVAMSVFAGTKIATTLLVMVVPIIDFFWVIGRRFFEGKSIFDPGREHLHHRLLEMGWTQREVVVFFWGITLLTAILAINVTTVGKFLAVIVIAIIMLFLYLRIIGREKGETI